MLDLFSYFTAGLKRSQSLVSEDFSTAPEAAGKIHTDFEKGFITEVV